VDCDRWQEALSARADGEDPGVDERLLDAHLVRCTACTSFAAAIDGSRRRSTVREAEPLPDLSGRVVKANAILDRAGTWSIVRALLVVVAAEIIVLSAPALVLGEGDSDAHGARHLGAFSVAYAVALIVAAVRPARARTVLPVAAVLAGALAVTAVGDIVASTIPLVNEATHIPELISVVLVWLLASPSRRRDQTRSTPIRPLLRLADSGDNPGRARRAG
jgi:predicted anti-sigma-YlaC factor YlaD